MSLNNEGLTEDELTERVARICRSTVGWHPVAEEAQLLTTLARIPSVSTVPGTHFNHAVLWCMQPYVLGKSERRTGPAADQIDQTWH
jgi:hypothetical protein